MGFLYVQDPQTGEWTYPSSADVLEEVGLRSIRQYIEVRRQTIAVYIVDRPIFSCCIRDGERMRGTSPRIWWWQQSMDLDLARGANAVPIVSSDDEDAG
ncbi:hypothetical protein ACHAXR_001230 [Thalassiosira sp. AJA248-18]